MMPECISVVIDEISGIDRPTPCLTYELLHLTLISQKNSPRWPSAAKTGGWRVSERKLWVISYFS